MICWLEKQIIIFFKPVLENCQLCYVLEKVKKKHKLIFVKEFDIFK